MERWLAKINKLSNWQAAFIITAVGIAVFFSGLTNPFMGDDNSQVVDNPVVHSISNIRLFFEGGTFYNGQGIVPLSGAYYRPLMTTAFSLLYTAFGLHAIAFHAFQLSLYIASATILYLFFRYSFSPMLSLVLSLIFLVHPINSQTVLAIPSMQDVLFFFFGMLALWMLINFSSARSLFVVAFSLLLSLLSKESGIFFVAMALLYLFWWDSKRLYPFIAIISWLPLALWLAIKTNAVGLLGTKPNNAPIDSLNFVGRLMTAPSILLFYITKFIFPWKLASAYYWVYPVFNIRHVLLPLMIDLTVIALFVSAGILIRRLASRAMFYTYLFFGVWAGIGLLSHLQIIPLDMTVCETWFYFPMAGVLGLIGVILATFKDYIRPSWLYLIAVLVIGVLGFRTVLRGTDWKDTYTLASHDIIASKEQFNAYNTLAIIYFSQSDYNMAKTYAAKSVAIYPVATNNNTLGGALFALGDYPKAYAAFTNGLKSAQLVALYENLAQLTVVYGDPKANEQFLLRSTSFFPQNMKIWLYLAIQQYRNGDITNARSSITNAVNYGQVPQEVYDGIINNRPFSFNIDNNKTIFVQLQHTGL